MWPFSRRKKKVSHDLQSIELDSIPVVQFDRRRITQAVKNDLNETIALLEDIPISIRQGLFDEALQSAPKRDLSALTRYIQNLRLNSMTPTKAADISRFIANRMTSSIQQHQQSSLGITEAIWLYSGAPCGFKPDFAINASHRAVGGKKFKIETGMRIAGKYTWPGREPGCKCVSQSVIKGFS
jgi:hypothetical protein